MITLHLEQLVCGLVAFSSLSTRCPLLSVVQETDYPSIKNITDESAVPKASPKLIMSHDFNNIVYYVNKILDARKGSPKVITEYMEIAFSLMFLSIFLQHRASLVIFNNVCFPFQIRSTGKMVIDMKHNIRSLIEFGN